MDTHTSAAVAALSVSRVPAASRVSTGLVALVALAAALAVFAGGSSAAEAQPTPTRPAGAADPQPDARDGGESGANDGGGDDDAGELSEFIAPDDAAESEGGAPIRPISRGESDDGVQVVDFGEEAGGAAVGDSFTARDPAGVEHETLMPDRFRRGLRDAPQATAVRSERGAAWDLRVGAVAATLGGDVDARSRLGVAAGVAVAIPIAGPMRVRPELWFASRGAGVADADDVALNYLSIPALISLRKRFGGVEVEVAAGPSLGVALASEVAIGPMQVDVSRFELGAVAGAALALTRTPRVVIEARYERGLTDVFSSDAAPSARNRSLLLALGYRL